MSVYPFGGSCWFVCFFFVVYLLALYFWYPVGHLEFGCNRDFFQLDTWSPGATESIILPVGHLEFGCNRDPFQLDTWSPGATVICFSFVLLLYSRFFFLSFSRRYWRFRPAQGEVLVGRWSGRHLELSHAG